MRLRPTLFALLALAGVAITGMARAYPATAETKPLVKRPPAHQCYDPPPRAACKQRCAVEQAEQLAKCEAACPPKVCSRGKGR